MTVDFSVLIRTLYELGLSFLQTMDQAYQFLFTPFREIFAVQIITTPPTNVLEIPGWFLDNALFWVLDLLIDLPYRVLELFGIQFGDLTLIQVIFSSTVFYGLLTWGIVKSFVT